MFETLIIGARLYIYVYYQYICRLNVTESFLKIRYGTVNAMKYIENSV